MTGRELFFIAQAHFSSCIAGDGQFTRQCSEWIERKIGVRRALLTHSATTALELIAMLLDLREGDEIIMPSFTFVTTANAFVREKAVPVFVDIDTTTLNISPAAIQSAITPRTRAIVVVHYAGVACDMDAIQEIADAHGIPVIEDAAHGILARHRDRQLPRDEKHYLRRRRRTPHQRPAVCGAGRDSAGEGHQPEGISERTGR
jgi:dTDP-4-amino-4,6-dideoxygalactose transaminase